MSTSMNINDTLFIYLNATKIAKEHRESEEGEGLKSFSRLLNSIAKNLLDYHCYRNCCSRKILDTLNFNVDPMNNMVFHPIIRVIMLI
jgi:hypothetical protein